MQKRELQQSQRSSAPSFQLCSHRIPANQLSPVGTTTCTRLPRKPHAVHCIAHHVNLDDMWASTNTSACPTSINTTVRGFEVGHQTSNSLFRDVCCWRDGGLESFRLLAKDPYEADPTMGLHPNPTGSPLELSVMWMPSRMCLT